LAEHGLISGAELRQLLQGREFLWLVRLGLHLLTGRREDRLLFDHQSRLAALFGYRDASYMLAVEQLMQRYYRTVMDLSLLNEMLLQRFQEAILVSPDAPPEPIDERFEVRNGFLQVTHDEVFEDDPSALLAVFLVLQQHAGIKGVGAGTIALIRRSLHLVDDAFRQDPRNHALFLQILRAPEGVTHELRRMNRYGVLGRYVPAFGRVVGRMQYDLFHTYTVDEHTLFVVSNLRRFALSRFDHEFPRCSEIMQGLPVPEVAYVAGLFHDIAKGRGGDHSEMGAVDAEAFCLEHGMSRYEARLVAWLVRHHLLLSLTAQKRDISDPAVISEFAGIVGDEEHLDYLYVLTIADVRATNPKLWNSWRAQLFDELYGLAKLALRRGLENPVDKDELIAERRDAAMATLEAGGLEPDAVEALWAGMGEEYFLRCRPEEIAWHTRLLCHPARDPRAALVGVQEEARSGGSGVVIYTPREQDSFATATAVLDELGLNIADARILRLDNGFSLATYIVLEQTGGQVDDASRREQIRRRLTQRLTSATNTPLRVSRRPPRQVRMFTTPTRVVFGDDPVNHRTVIELTAGDRPGLLCRVGQVLQRHGVWIEAAKIMTVGERAEDVFYVTDDQGRPLGAPLCTTLAGELREALDSQP
ncbi:MAG: [protein-PII] uridylyltransferase, partial [Chromatiales bacterium]|nr:[protein-PII] uridylyltransferase [Chromatiales bacterium]